MCILYHFLDVNIFSENLKKREGPIQNGGKLKTLNSTKIARDQQTTVFKTQNTQERNSFPHSIYVFVSKKRISIE